MNKNEFIAEVRSRLCGLPEEELTKSLEYFSEMIDDRIENGVSEQDAVADIGSPENAAAQILSEISLPKLVKARIKPSRALRAWEIVLLILGAPVWFPLLVALVIAFLSIYFSLWCCIAALCLVVLSVLLTGILMLVSSVILLLRAYAPTALLMFGGGLVCIGCSVLLYFPFKMLTQLLWNLSKRFVLWIKSIFIKRSVHS